MKKTFKTILLLLLAVNLTILSCKKESIQQEEQLKDDRASYEFKIDGNVISSSDDVPFGILLDFNGHATHISVYETDQSFGMGFTGMPFIVGNSVQMNIDVAVSVNGPKIDDYTDHGWFNIESGTMTRVADNKVIFTGTFEYDGTTYTASGFIKSNGLKNH